MQRGHRLLREVIGEPDDQVRVEEFLGPKDMWSSGSSSTLAKEVHPRGPQDRIIGMPQTRRTQIGCSVVSSSRPEGPSPLRLKLRQIAAPYAQSAV